MWIPRSQTTRNSSSLCDFACYSASSYQIPPKSSYSRRSSDVVYNFKMAAAVAQYTTFGVIFNYLMLFVLSVFRSSKSTYKPNYVHISQFIATSSWEKQTSAILDFFFRLRFWPYRTNRHVILYQSIKFHPNRSTRGKDKTSYRFLKMAAVAAQYYFRFPVCWISVLRKVKIYHQTKLRRHTSFHGWDITTSFLGKTKVHHIGILLPVSISITSP